MTATSGLPGFPSGEPRLTSRIYEAAGVGVSRAPANRPGPHRAGRLRNGQPQRANLPASPHRGVGGGGA
jgi:hypothetical protein